MFQENFPFYYFTVVESIHQDLLFCLYFKVETMCPIWVIKSFIESEQFLHHLPNAVFQFYKNFARICDMGGQLDCH